MKTLSLRFALLLAVLTFIALAVPSSASAQRRDYLTDAEIELVRDAQEIDRRIDVLTKAVSRRFQVLKNESGSDRQAEKDSQKWGESPKGTRAELLMDIQKILQKAIDDIDDVAERNMDSKLFPKAVNKLSDACREYLPQFKKFFDASKDDRERGAILSSIENCSSIIEASAKVPKEENKKKN